MTIRPPANIGQAQRNNQVRTTPARFPPGKTPARFDPNNSHKINYLGKSAIPPEPISIPPGGHFDPTVGIVRPANPTLFLIPLDPSPRICQNLVTGEQKANT
jgi:hypothetical protein